MDFFAKQDVARRKTGRLVVLFALATLSIIASVYAVVTGALIYTSRDFGFWHPTLLLAVGGVTVTVIAGGSLFKIAQLRGGGRVVAESMGGRLIPQDTPDPLARKILNVVEEMAIASGTPVPPVYLMEREKGINAFAAGYTPNDAVIGVTRGCVEKLSRDELQGVMAHEFSHILNGDMRMNIRLIGILHGILIIGIIGYFMLRTASFGGGRRRGDDRSGMALLAAGLGLMAIGFLGTMFGNMIKAAVSRQREYLADATAVQFTRDPIAVSGALKRIGAEGSAVADPAAVEASHMFFASALAKGLNASFSTHPPLADRIRRIDSSWDGKYPERLKAKPAPGAKKDTKSAGIDVAELVTGAAILAGAGAGATRGAGPAAPQSAESGAVSQIGNPTPAHVAYAAALIRDLPAPVAAAVREPYGARAVIYALLIDGDPETRQRQLDMLHDRADVGVEELTRTLIPPVADLDDRARLPLIDLALPALRELSPDQNETFRDNVAELIRADSRVDLFEWVLQRMILHHLEPSSTEVDRAPVRHRSLRNLQESCALLLSALSHTGHADHGAARAAFEQGRLRLGLKALEFHEREACSLSDLDQALDVLNQTTFELKRDLLEAAAECIRADKQVTVQEAEMFRGVADALGCPMPPLLPGQSLT